MKFDGKNIPTPAVYAVDFGDGSVSDSAEINPGSNSWEKSFTHLYTEEGNYTVVVNISNPVDFEIFEVMVRRFFPQKNLKDFLYCIILILMLHPMLFGTLGTVLR